MSETEQNLMNPLKIIYRRKTFNISSEHPIPRNAILSGFDFSRIRRTPRNSYNGRLNLRGADLSFLNLSNCNLENVDLSYAKLFDSNLDSSIIANSIFFKCDIQGAKFTNLESTKTNGANFTESYTGIDTEFTDTDLSNVYFNDWYDKMYPRRGDSTLYLTDEQQIKDLNDFNRTFPTEEALENAIREGEARLNLPFGFNENGNNDEFQPFLIIEREREQAEEDVRQGLNTEQRGMQQADIESNQARLQDRLRRATAQAQALIANNPEESKFGICPICQENLNNGEAVVDAHNNEKGNKSDHIFHKGCLERWCERSVECPICKTNVECNKILNGERNITLKGGKRSKRSKRKTNKRVKRATNKKVKRRKRRVTNKKRK